MLSQSIHPSIKLCRILSLTLLNNQSAIVVPYFICQASKLSIFVAIILQCIEITCRINLNHMFNKSVNPIHQSNFAGYVHWPYWITNQWWLYHTSCIKQASYQSFFAIVLQCIELTSRITLNHSFIKSVNPSINQTLRDTFTDYWLTNEW